MIQRIEGLTWFALLPAIAVLVGTALPTWWGDHLGGNRLLVHMMASGVVVVMLPVYGFIRWSRWMGGHERHRGEPTVFWLMMASGFLTIATMLACMLPLASTDTMHALVQLHGWVGHGLALTALSMLLILSKRKRPSAGTALGS